jgi:hypothetical protein
MTARLLRDCGLIDIVADQIHRFFGTLDAYFQPKSMLDFASIA